MILDLFRLDGRVALVTGAGQGLGQAMAIGLAEAGADIVALDRRECEQTGQAVMALGRRFKSITGDRTFKQYFDAPGGEKLKTAPQGYDRDHPEIELLRLKEVVAVHQLSDESVLSPGFAAHVLKAFRAMKPFLDYLNSVIA